MSKENIASGDKARRPNVKRTALLIVCLVVLSVVSINIYRAVNYSKAMNLINDGQYKAAATILPKLGGFKKSDDLMAQCIENLQIRNVIFAGPINTVAIRADGTVIATGAEFANMDDVSGWTDITAVTAGFAHTVGLRSDGTVLSTDIGAKDESLDYGQCDVSDWSDITAIAAGFFHTIGLKADGTVVAAGQNNYGQCEVSDWTDVKTIYANRSGTVGITYSGNVLYCGENGNMAIPYVEGFSFNLDDFTAIWLLPNGRIKAGMDAHGHDKTFKPSEWKGIIDIDTGYQNVFALRAGGTVVATGSNEHGQCDVSEWTDIVAVSSGGVHTIGLKSDGTVVAAGSNLLGGCDVMDWTGIKTN